MIYSIKVNGMFRKEVEDIGDFVDDGFWVLSYIIEGFGGWGRVGR